MNLFISIINFMSFVILQKCQQHRIPKIEFYFLEICAIDLTLKRLLSRHIVYPNLLF